MCRQPSGGIAGAARSSVKTQAFMDIVADMAFSSKEWYAATNRGLLVSRDSGATWTRRPVGGLVTVSVQSVRVSANGLRIRIASQRGLVFSDDGGKSWTWHDPPPNSADVLVLDMNPDDENMLVAVAVMDFTFRGMRAEPGNMRPPGCPPLPFRIFPPTAAGLSLPCAPAACTFLPIPETRGTACTGAAGDTIFAAVSLSNTRGQVMAASATDGIYRVELPDSAARGANAVE